MSKLNWLDKFAEEQSKKMQKTASFKKVAEQIIVDTDEIPDAIDGQEVSYKNKLYKVLNANYKDEIGSGIVLEKIAELDGEVLPAEMSMEMGTDVAPTTPEGQKKVTEAPEKAVQPDQGNAGLHIEVRDTVEVEKFNQEAVETEQQVAQENAVDRTTPEGKYNRIEKRIQEMTQVEAPVVEEVVTEEVVEDLPVEEVETEETFEEEVPTDEIEIAEDSVEEVEQPEEVEETEEVETECELTEEECEEDKKQIISNRILSKIFNR